MATLSLITRTSMQNQALFEAPQRQIEVAALVAKRNGFQAEFDGIFAIDLDYLTTEALKKAKSLMTHIARLNKTIRVKGTIRSKTRLQ